MLHKKRAKGRFNSPFLGIYAETLSPAQLARVCGESGRSGIGRVSAHWGGARDVHGCCRAFTRAWPVVCPVETGLDFGLPEADRLRPRRRGQSACRLQRKFIPPLQNRLCCFSASLGVIHRPGVIVLIVKVVSFHHSYKTSAFHHSYKTSASLWWNTCLFFGRLLWCGDSGQKSFS